MAVSSDVCSTEDAVQVFLQHLVDPFLPEKSSVRDNPSPSQHQLIAKQVHSVVLLYNYYHRKQHPELEYLPFNEFCKLIVVLRPPLLAYMQFMQKLNEVELVDVEKQLSLTEKVIMDACDICQCLDASKTVPNVQGWPISKVSILLIDSKKQNCFLLFDSITSGVWSVVEKNVDTSSQNPQLESETKNKNKRKRVIKKSAKDEFKVDEDELLQVGYSAIKEATGINNIDIFLLESYTIYSQSKEKAASRFFIMQCSQSINQEMIKVPLKDVIESLKGPLVKKSSSSWTITPAVVYFHVLPYSEVISQCISRKEFSNSLQDSRVTKKNIMVNVPEVTESYIRKEIYCKPSEDTFETQEQKENNGSCTLRPRNYIKETHEMDVNKSSIFPSQNKEKCQKISNSIQFGEDQAKNNPSVQCNSNGSANAIQAMKVGSTRILTNVPEVTESYIRKEIYSGIDSKASKGTFETQKENNGSCSLRLRNYIKETHEMDVNKSSIYPSQNKDKCQKISNSIQFGEDQAKNNPSVQCNSNCSANAMQQAMKIDSTRILINVPEVTESYKRKEIYSGIDSKASEGTFETQEQKENNGSCSLRLRNYIKETHEMDVNRSSIYPSQNKDKCQKISNSIQFGEDQAKNNPSVQCNSNCSANAMQAMKVNSTRILINEGGINNIASSGKLCANRPNISYAKDTTDACTKSSNHSNSDRENPQSLQDSKKKLSRTAIASLIRKKSQLAIQQRKIEEEIAICDTKLERLLTDGKDDFESMIECIVEGCNDVLVTDQEVMGEQQSFPRKRRNLSEAQSSCQIPS